MDINMLQQAAVEAASKSYAVYSDFHVGAAVLSDDGKIFMGTNVENRSYGLTVCAERNAVGNAVLGGMKKIKAVAVYSPDADTPLPPCGACRQVLTEFSDENTEVYLGSKDKKFIKILMKELYPLDSLHNLKNKN